MQSTSLYCEWSDRALSAGFPLVIRSMYTCARAAQFSRQKEGAEAGDFKSGVIVVIMFLIVSTSINCFEIFVSFFFLLI